MCELYLGYPHSRPILLACHDCTSIRATTERVVADDVELDLAHLARLQQVHCATPLPAVASELSWFIASVTMVYG